MRNVLKLVAAVSIGAATAVPAAEEGSTGGGSPNPPPDWAIVINDSGRRIYAHERWRLHRLEPGAVIWMVLPVTVTDGERRWGLLQGRATSCGGGSSVTLEAAGQRLERCAGGTFHLGAAVLERCVALGINPDGLKWTILENRICVYSQNWEGEVLSGIRAQLSRESETVPGS